MSTSLSQSGILSKETRSHPKDDPVGQYFRCFQRATGEPVLVEILSTLADGTHVQDWFNHTDHDAQGALLHIQRVRGELPLALPRRRTEARLSLFKRLQAFAAWLPTILFAPKPTLGKDAEARIHARAFHSLGLEESAGLRSWIQSRGVSMTAMLMWTLHRAMGELAGQPEHLCRWSVPVTMRGLLDFPDIEGNFAMPLFLAFDGRQPIHSVHRLLQNQLDRQLHWGALLFLQLLARLPASIYTHIIRQDEAKMVHTGQWFAIMSNAGAIDGDPRVSARAFFPAVDANCPLSAAALSWNGRLTLSVHVHEALRPARLEAESLMSQWIKVLQEEGILMNGREPS